MLGEGSDWPLLAIAEKQGLFRLSVAYVQQEFEDCLKCGRLKRRLLRVHCNTSHAELPVAFSRERLTLYT